MLRKMAQVAATIVSAVVHPINMDSRLNCPPENIVSVCRLSIVMVQRLMPTVITTIINGLAAT